VVILNEEEAAELLSFQSDGALQPLHAQLLEQLANGNRKVSLPDPLLGRLVRVMAWGYGPTHTLLARVFQRPLVHLLQPQAAKKEAAGQSG
jgi:hypothetical protein